MRTLAEVLRAADPLGDEPPRTNSDRTTRQAALDAPPAADGWSRRSIVRVAVVAVAVATIAVGMRSWPRGVADLVAAVRFEVRLAEERPAAGLTEVTAGDRTIYLHQESIVTNTDIADAQVVKGEGSDTFSVHLVFTADGAAKMKRASQDHIGRPVAILIDGAVVMAPVVRSPMSTSAVITGQFTQAEAQRIVGGIRGR
ncbi:MAG TPA: hypothetical protein VGJ29_15275 [Vicinamibacterales bacterium]